MVVAITTNYVRDCRRWTRALLVQPGEEMILGADQRGFEV